MKKHKLTKKKNIYILDTYILLLFEYFHLKIFEAYKPKTEDRVYFKNQIFLSKCNKVTNSLTVCLENKLILKF